MSFQGNLFIPRKQNLTGAESQAAHSFGPGSTPVIPPMGTDASAWGSPNSTSQANLPSIDAVHLERALRDNFLAIQRWANYQGIVAIGSSGATVASPSTFTLLPFGAIQTTGSRTGVASSSASTITIPDNAWYTIGATAIWDDTLVSSTAQGYLNLSLVDASNPSVPLTEGAPVYLDETIGGSAGFPYQSISYTRSFTKGQVLQLRVLETRLAGITAGLVSLFIRREGVIPSSVQ